MCDIWKGNRNLKQLEKKDIEGLLSTLKKYGTQQVLMSGGEALLNADFFRFCEILKSENIRITLLSTGLTIRHHAQQLIKWVDDLIISLDGDEPLHDAIRNIPGAFAKLREGISYIRSLDPNYRITGRSVIHRLNYKHWPAIINSALEIGLHQISFLPADVSSQAFNRNTPWNTERQDDVKISRAELAELETVTDYILEVYQSCFNNRFIAESPEKIKKILAYYRALHGLNPFPYKKCNAPWVSAVIEADGTVLPCFFHEAIGNIHENSLEEILNNKKALTFRKELDMDTNLTCKQCVCYLNLPPASALR